MAIADPPAAPATAADVHPGLAALFELDIPPVAETPPNAETDVVEAFHRDTQPPPPEKVDATKAEEKKLEPVAKSPLTARLAPDFAAAPAKATDAAPTDDAEITEEMIAAEQSPKKQADMRRLGETLTRYKRENADLKTKVNQVPSEDPESKRLLGEAQKQNEDLLERISRLDLTQNPVFQRDFLAPREKEFTDAQQIVKDYAGDVDKLKRAMALPHGTARTEILDELAEGISSPMMRRRFEDHISAIDTKTAAINDKLKNARHEDDNLKREEKANRHEQMVHTEKQLKGLLGSTRRDLVDNMKLEVLQKSGKPDYGWWDSQVDEIDQIAEEVLLKSTPEKAAVAAYLAASCGAYRSMFQAERDARMALEKELAEFRGAYPKTEAERKASVDTSGIDPNDILANLKAGKYAGASNRR